MNKKRIFFTCLITGLFFLPLAGMAGEKESDARNIEKLALQDEQFSPPALDEPAAAVSLEGFKYDPTLTDDKLQTLLEKEDPPSGRFGKSVETAAESNEATIQLIWQDKADLDLWIENQEGRLAGPQETAENGPGSETYRPSLDSSADEDRMYYVAVYMNPPAEESDHAGKASAELRILFPGVPAHTMKVDLDYDGGQDFWVACSLNPANGKIETIERFAGSISEALEA